MPAQTFSLAQFRAMGVVMYLAARLCSFVLWGALRGESVGVVGFERGVYRGRVKA